MLMGKEIRRLKELASSKGVPWIPYSKEEIEKMSREDLERIDRAIRNPKTQEEEFRYFSMNDPLMIMTIGAKISRMTRVVSSWQEAKALNCLASYFSGVNGWPIVSSPYVIKYSEDARSYYELFGITSWRKAKECGKLARYFQGWGFFPKVEDAYMDCWNVGDYESYLKSISFEEYLVHLRDFSSHIPARFGVYDSPLVFYQTAMCQISEYISVISKLEGKIYIPGDGLGLASYVCKLLKKDYFSCEPNEIGRDAIVMGLISSKEVFSEDHLKGCSVIFFGNCVYEIFSDVIELNKYRDKYKIVVYDEKGLALSRFQNSKLLRVGGKLSLDFSKWFSFRPFYPGMTYKIWYSWDVGEKSSFRFSEFYRRDVGNKMWLPTDNVAESVLAGCFLGERGFLPHMNRVERLDFSSTNDWYGDLKQVLSRYVKRYRLPYSVDVHGIFHIDLNRSDDIIQDFVLSYLEVMYWYNYSSFVAFVRGNGKYLRLFAERWNYSVIYVTSRDVGLSRDLDLVSLNTRSYLKDYIRGRMGCMKFVGDSVRLVYPGWSMIVEDGYYCIGLKEYDRADTLEQYDQVGNEFIAKVRNPMKKQYINVNGSKVKIVLVYYDDKSNVARYRLVQSFLYNNDLEIVDG